MLLNDIKTKLEQLDPNVYYGLMTKKPEEVPVWDYTVFNRTKLRSGQDKNSFADVFEVHIVRENFIPEGLDLDYIAKMREIPGVRLMSEDVTYDYMQKSNTDTVVEMLTLTFVRARK